MPEIQYKKSCLFNYDLSVSFSYSICFTGYSMLRSTESHNLQAVFRLNIWYTNRWCAHYDCDALWIPKFQDGGEGREISQVICFIFQ